MLHCCFPCNYCCHGGYFSLFSVLLVETFSLPGDALRGCKLMVGEPRFPQGLPLTPAETSVSLSGGPGLRGRSPGCGWVLLCGPGYAHRRVSAIFTSSVWLNCLCLTQ